MEIDVKRNGVYTVDGISNPRFLLTFRIYVWPRVSYFVEYDLSVGAETRFGRWLECRAHA